MDGRCYWSKKPYIELYRYWSGFQLIMAESKNDEEPLLERDTHECINDNIYEDVAVDSTESIAPQSNNGTIRNLIGFWVLGLCNNYAYVIMLSAAHDILADKSTNGTNLTDPESIDCNKFSTGTILLADVIPSLVIKTIAPFIAIPTFARLTVVVVLSLLSFVTVALSQVKWLAFLGVVFASLSGGLGEVTLLAYSARFNKNVVSTWSSGTGASGVIGALSYAGLTGAGLSPRTTLLAMSIIPVIMALCFFCVLQHPPGNANKCCALKRSDSESPAIRNRPLTLKRKLIILKGLLSYMIPLSLVYFAEYFINQGLMEHIYFPGITLSRSEQYRWFQVDYQVGVFISRSSVNIITINKLWILPILQFMNAVCLFTEAYFLYMPSIWLVLSLVFFEGLLGGAAYVNTFYKIVQRVPEPHREFSMGAASMGDSFGVALAGAITIPVHSALCKRYH